MQRLFRKELAIVFSIALAVRIAFVLWNWSGFYTGGTIALASRDSLAAGYGIAAGWGYVENAETYGLATQIQKENVRFSPETTPPLKNPIPFGLRPPGVPILVFIIHRLFGVNAYVPLQLIGVVLDCIAACLTFYVSKLCFGQKVGFYAGILYAVFPPLAYMSSVAITDGMLSVFIVAFLTCLVLSAQSRGKRAVAWLIGAGLAIGLGAYVRPDYLLLPVFTFLGLWAYSKRFFRSLIAIALIQAAAYATLLPWAYRNHLVFDRWLFTSTSVGATLIAGISDFANPWGYISGDSDRHAEAQKAGFYDAWSSDADLYFRNLFWKHVKERPDVFLSHAVKRLPFCVATPFWWGYDNPAKIAFHKARRESKMSRDEFCKKNLTLVMAAHWHFIPPMLFVFACTICVLITFIAERRRFGLTLLAFSPHIYSIIAHALTHIEERFLAPSIFCWLIAMAYVLAKGWRNRPAATECNWGKQATPV